MIEPPEPFAFDFVDPPPPPKRGSLAPEAMATVDAADKTPATAATFVTPDGRDITLPVRESLICVSSVGFAILSTFSSRGLFSPTVDVCAPVAGGGQTLPPPKLFAPRSAAAVATPA